MALQSMNNSYSETSEFGKPKSNKAELNKLENLDFFCVNLRKSQNFYTFYGKGKVPREVYLE